MSDSATAPGQMSEPPANEARLESWGEIASYLRRDVRTVQRWERYHGLPVRRLQVGKLLRRFLECRLLSLSAAPR
jgi:hypothetical protein